MKKENKFVDEIKTRVEQLPKKKRVQNQWEKLKWKVVLIERDNESNCF